MPPSRKRQLSIVLVANAYFPADREGGPPFSNRELAEALVRAGAIVRVVTTDRNGSSRLEVPVDQWIDVGGVPVYHSRAKRGAWRRAASFRGALRTALADADVCIMSAIFWNYTGFASWIECRRAGTPYATYARGLLNPWALQHKGTKKLVYWHLVGKRIVSGSSMIVALANEEAEDVQRMNLKVPVTVIPNGAPTTPISDLRQDQVPKAALQAPYILFLGRIHPKKGVDILIRAFEMCVARGVSTRLVIAGPVDAEYAREFGLLLDTCVVRDRIDVVGTVSGQRKSELLVGALAFVLPSHGEGLPMAVLEAMSFGIPVVITRGCNLPEVAKARAGIEVDATAESVTEALIRITQDESFRSSCSKNGVALVAEAFSWDAIGARVMELCVELSKPRESMRPRVSGMRS